MQSTSSSPPAAEPLTDEIVGVLANRADVDARTMVRGLAGLPVKGRAGVRVARVIAAWRRFRAEAASTF